MSLISEALKRTQQRASVSAPRAPLLRKPIGATSAPRETSRKVFLVLVVGIFVVSGVALWGLWRMYAMLTAKARLVQQATVVEPPSPQPPPAASQAVVPPPIPEAIRAAVRAEDLALPKPAPVASPPPSPPSAVPPAPKLLPKLVLQGVTIHAGIREALINGQIVGVGDEVEGAKVVAIEPMRVRLSFDGREFTLSLY